MQPPDCPICTPRPFIKTIICYFIEGLQQTYVLGLDKRKRFAFNWILIWPRHS